MDETLRAREPIGGEQQPALDSLAQLAKNAIDPFQNDFSERG
jgi:hypothetical protein